VSEENPPIVFATFFGDVAVDAVCDDAEVQKNLRALEWIKEIVEGSNGSLFYETKDDSKMVVATLWDTEVKVDVRECAQRSLSSVNWSQGHVPAFVNESAMCIQMGDGAFDGLPDLDLCASLLLLLSADAVPSTMIPTTLYHCLPLKEIVAMLGSGDSDVVEGAISSLGGREGPAAKRLLKQSVYQAREPILCIAALEAIVFGRHQVNAKPYLPLIVEYTMHAPGEVKVRAIELLGLIVDYRDKHLIAVLRRLIRYNHHCVQHYLLQPYVEMAGADAAEDLIFLLKHRPPSWHDEIIRAISSLEAGLARQILSTFYPKAENHLGPVIAEALRALSSSPGEIAATEFVLGLNHSGPIDDLVDIDADLLRFD